ncbi:oxidoreductase [Escherichia coli]|nr:oxidoreductase [Escherichia coli]
MVVDKPFTVTLSQARELDALAKSLGRVLSVFHNRRWDSDFLTLKGLLAEGVLGEVAYFESHFDRFRPQVRDRWREQGGPGSGIWYDLAPHLLDQAITLFGLPGQHDGRFGTVTARSAVDRLFSTPSCPIHSGESFYTVPCWQPLSQHGISCMDPEAVM